LGDAGDLSFGEKLSGIWCFCYTNEIQVQTI
jgi:hypothetical protein